MFHLDATSNNNIQNQYSSGLDNNNNRYPANGTSHSPNMSNSIYNNATAGYQQTYDYSQQQFYNQQQQQQQQQQQHRQQHPQQQPQQQQQQQQQQTADHSQQPQPQPSQQQVQSQNIPFNNPMFTPQDIQILKQLLLAGEKHKWKQITKEINYQAATRRGETYVDDSHSYSPVPNHSSPSNPLLLHHHQQQQQQQSPPSSQQSKRGTPAPTTKNVSPTFVIKQYQSLLGLPNNALHFGILGSSLPYVVAPNGWDELNNSELFNNQNTVE